MCGIIGAFPGDETEIEKGLLAIAHRGKDSRRVERVGIGVIGHALHRMVGDVSQPLQGEGTLLFNGEIYNWRELADSQGIDASNDAELLLGLLDRDGPDCRSLLDGVYAYAYVRDGKVILERDLLGVKPLFYSQEPFAFASERKALVAIGLPGRELHPRTTLAYDIATGSLKASVRPMDFKESSRPIDEILKNAVSKRLPDGRVGVMFSGGVDSALVARLCADRGAQVTLYVAALDDPQKDEPHDLLAAREAAKSLGLELVEVRVTLDEVEQLIPKVCRAIEDSGVVKVGVALPFWLCARRAAADGLRVLMSGLGAEEVFAGYQRHKRSMDINRECLRGLRMMHERDLYRDDVVGMHHTIEIRLPLLDHELIAAGLSIPGEHKIVDGVTKMPLREAAIRLGVPEGIAMRPKKAAQYGSQFDAAIDKLARRSGVSKSDYLKRHYPTIRRLCALLSGGKDSVYAMHVMRLMNYGISCCATIESSNPDSYMYHTPLVGFARLQAESLGLPLLVESTPGEKESELDALRVVLQRAIDEHGVEGVVSGALYSDYQRSRIERVCEELGLEVHAPLWHIDQEQEVREIMDAGFTFVLSKVAAEGLDASWVGRPIVHEDVDVLSGKLGLNVAGEGGEYESLVLDGPGFSRPIVLEDESVDCEESGSAPVCVLRASGSLGTS